MRPKIYFAAILLIAATVARAGEPSTTQPARAEVRVRMAGSGQPVVDAKVSWFGDEDLKGSGRTDASGKCAIENISDRNSWIYVRVSQNGMVPLSLEWRGKMTVDAPSPPPFDFEMEKGTTIGGQVVDEAGKPIARANVVVSVVKKYPGSSQRVDLSWKAIEANAHGQWSLKGVPAQPEGVEIAAYDMMHLTADYYSPEPYKPLSALWDGTARLTLPRGTLIEVTVLKPDGTPASGAEVFFGSEREVSNSYDPVHTDSKGRVEFGCKPGMSCVLTASLPGYGPANEAVSAPTEPARVTLRLSAPSPRTIDVVDASGKPVHDAGIWLSKWRGRSVLARRLETDAAGRAVWKDGPADDVMINVNAAGFLATRDFAWSAGKPARITLSQPTTVEGHVVDAQSGEPIKTFTIRAGAVWQEGDRMVWQTSDWSLTEQARKTPGKFSMELTEPAFRYLLRVGADGYLPEDTPLFDPQASGKTFEFALKKGQPIAGRVTAADDQPVAGADVYLVTTGDWMGLDNGTVRESSQNNCAHVKSGADGRFVLPPQKEDFALLALSDRGTASLARKQIGGGDATLKLLSWAKVRGTIEVGGKPAADIDVSGSAEPINLGDDTVVSQQYFFKTDQDGHFELPRVPAGRLVLTRQMPNHSPGRMWYVGLGTIDAKPGEDYDLQLGQGVCVTGQLMIPPGKQWMVRQARLELKGQPHIENWENVEVLADGHFRADGLQPGDYVLHVALHEFPPNNDCGWGRVVGVYDKEITVGAGSGTMDIGSVAANPIVASDLAIGDLAPDFTVTTLEGKSVRLTELRGKVVLVDFWATWCAPCVAELPNMQKLAAAHASEARFATIGLSLDENQQDLSGYLKRASITLPEAWVGVDSSPVKAYGATAIPATFLIGPDGRILARDLRGEDLRKAVEAQLGAR